MLNLFKNSEVAYVINWKFHKKNKWVSALTPYLINEIVRNFTPLIIENQFEYSLNKKKIKYIISSEPGWSSKFITYDTNRKHIIFMFCSDPHNKIGWLEEYVQKNNISYILSYYYNPFLYHFPNFPKDKIIHFPWAIPDNFVVKEDDIKVRNDNVVIFGGSQSDAYDFRNWCRNHPDVINYNFSGVENKKLSDSEYFIWLSQFDAIVAAGSTNPKYDLVTPKYFEILSSGALLIGQYCKDLDLLGLKHKENCLIFKDKDEFNQIIKQYKKNPDKYIEIRKNGLNLIKERHCISHRIQLLKSFINI